MLQVKERKRFCKYGHDTLIEGRSKFGYCKECHRISHRRFYRENTWYKDACNGQYKRHECYDIMQDEYAQMLEVQQHKCKICGILESSCKKRLSIDHDHKTGKVRGLLCVTCNLMLGYSKDNSTILQAAIEYLN